MSLLPFGTLGCPVHTSLGQVQAFEALYALRPALDGFLCSSEKAPSRLSLGERGWVGIVKHLPLAGVGPFFTPFLTGVVLNVCTCTQANTDTDMSVILHYRYTRGLPERKPCPDVWGTLSVVVEPVVKCGSYESEK
jgi:hypothetical protein